MKEKNNSGYTLIELLLAVTILCLVAAIVYGVFSSSQKSAEKGRDIARLNQSLRIVSEMMKRDMHSAFYTSPESIYKFIGKNHSSGQIPKDTINYSAFLPAQHRTNYKAESGVVEIGYEIRNTALEKGLFRRSASSPDSDPKEGGVYSKLDKNIVGMNLRYFKIEEMEDVWLDEWDSDKEESAPRAVEVTLITKHPQTGKEEKLPSFLVDIPVSMQISFSPE